MDAALQIAVKVNSSQFPFNCWTHNRNILSTKTQAKCKSLQLEFEENSLKLEFRKLKIAFRKMQRKVNKNSVI